MTDQPSARLVRRFYDGAWNRWDDTVVDELLAADFEFRGSLGDVARGPDGFRSYRDKVRAAFPDFHNEIRALVCDGTNAAVRLSCTGTHRGAVLGIPPTDRRVSYDAAAFLSVADDQISSVWALGDLDDLRRQLHQPHPTVPS